MDPNQTLVEMRELIAKMTEGLYPPAMIAAAGELADKFNALDDWMSRGGFVPKSWADGRVGSEVYLLTVKAEYGTDQTIHKTRSGALDTYRETCGMEEADSLPKNLIRARVLP